MRYATTPTEIIRSSVALEGLVRQSVLISCCPGYQVWYNSLYVRVLLNGRALAFQANDTGSIPVARSVGLIAQRLEQPAHNRSVPGSNPGGPTFHFLASPVRSQG